MKLSAPCKAQQKDRGVLIVTGTDLSESHKPLISLIEVNSASSRLENRFLFSGKKLQFQPFSTQRLH